MTSVLSVDAGGDDDRLIQHTNDFMQQIAAHHLPILYRYRKQVEEYQKKWPGHVPIYPDDLGDLIGLIHVLQRIEKRGGDSSKQPESENGS